MAIGDGTIKQNVNVQQAQTTPAGSVTPNPIVESSKNIVVPVAVDEELLKLLGLTLEQYLQLSDEQKSEVNNKINQIKNSTDETNFGIKGLSVEKTTTKVANDKLTSIENPVKVKAEVQQQESILKREDTSTPKITEADWKKMSSDERRTYIRAMTENILKDVPEDKRGELIKAAIDSRIKENRGFTDERWDKMPDGRKERLRERFISDFNIAIEKGFISKDELKTLTYEERLDLEIASKENHIKNIEELRKNLAVNAPAGDDANIKANISGLAHLNAHIEKDLADVQRKKEEKNLYSALRTESDMPSTIEAFALQYGKQPDFSTQEGKEAYFKFRDARMSAMSPQEGVKAVLSDIKGMFKYADEIEAKGNVEEANRIKKFALFNARRLGIDDNLAMRIEKGEVDPLEAQKVLDNLAKQMRKVKNPTAQEQDSINAVATNYAAIRTRGLPMSAEAEALYKDERYTESFGEGYRSIKGNKNIFDDLARLASQLDKKYQISETQKNMDYTYTFENEEDTKTAQKQIADTMGEFHVENQDDIYKIVMSSKFDEVQEYAANNIYKLDESVRDWASDYTKSLGKENLNDAIRTEPPAPDNSSDAASSVEQNYSSNEIPSQDSVSPVNFDDTPVETPQSEEQTVQMQEEFKKIDLNSAEAAQKFVEIVDKYNVQFSNYLAGLPQGQRTKMIELYCKNASPAKIFTFLKDNLSFYQTILNSAGTKLNMYKDDIFKLLKGKESNTVALATELGIDIMEYAKTNKEEAPDLAIVTKNTELARNILLNPGFYNYQPGSSVHQKLLELASSPKHNKKSDNSEMGNNLQIKA